MRRILDRYHTMQSGDVQEDNENNRLWRQIETQRRELEAMTRELRVRDSMLQQQQAALEYDPQQPSPNSAPAALEYNLPPLMAEPATQSPPHIETMSDMLQDQARELLEAQEAHLPTTHMVTDIGSPGAGGLPKKRAHEDLAEMSDDTAEVEDSHSDVEGQSSPGVKRARRESCVGALAHNPYKKVYGAPIQMEC